MDELFREGPARTPQTVTDLQLRREILLARNEAEPNRLLSALIRSIEQLVPLAPGQATADKDIQKLRRERLEALKHDLVTLGLTIQSENKRRRTHTPELDVFKQEAWIIMESLGDRLKSIGEKKSVRNWGDIIWLIKDAQSHYNKKMNARHQATLRKGGLSI